MKHLSYYCSDYLSPRELQEMNHVSALHRKISAAKQTIDDLQLMHFMVRESFRINRILAAIKRWNEELDQIFERNTE